MACEQCGSELVEPIDVDEPSESGHFSETWECQHCGAKGFIHGKEQQPTSRWDKFGSAFKA